MEISGIFNTISIKLFLLSKGSSKVLITLLVIIVMLTASVIMNDSSMFLYIPLGIILSREYKISLPFLVSIISIAANIGSALTPIGNPQNIIIWRSYKLSFIQFVEGLTPFVVLSMLILFIYIIFLTRNARIDKTTIPPPVKIDYRLFLIALFLLIANVILAQSGLEYIAFIITLIVLIILKRDVVIHLDYVLIVIFILMFADFGGAASLLKEHIISHNLSGRTLILVSALISQAVSNVPATILLIKMTNSWKSLAIGVNLGGVGIFIGSLANLIAIRMTGIKIKEFHKYTLPYFILLLLITLLIL